MLEIIAAAVGGYGVLLAGLYFGQRALLYRPDASVPDPAAHGVGEMTAIRIVLADGVESLAWWHPPSGPDLPVVVYFQGNAGHIGERAFKARRMIDAGFGVLLAGYRYNACAGGAPSEASLIVDGQSAIGHVLEHGYAIDQVVLYGESLGSGVAVALAAEHDVGGLILETPYSSIADVAQAQYWYVPAKWLIWDRFDSLSRIGGVRAPILVFHGDADDVIPIRFARRLVDAAPEPKQAYVLPGGGHADLYDFGAGDLVIRFLEDRARDRVTRPREPESAS